MNNMKHIMIAVAAAALAFGANAQQGKQSNYVGLNLGGGLNTMTFSPDNGKSSLGLGFDAGLHYAYFFNDHFGLGAGIHYTYANAYAKYNYTETTANQTHVHNGGVSYDLNTRFNDWRERQTVGVIGIPVEFFYRTALNDEWSFIGGIGAQFDMPIHGKYSADDGDYTTTGYFPILGYEVANMPEHGFATYDAAYDAKIDNLSSLVVSIIADAGVRYALGDNWGLYLGIYGSYGLTDMLGTKEDQSLLLINTTPDPAEVDYHGTYASNEIDALHLLRAGVKVGIDFGWGLTLSAKRAAAEEAARAEAERLAAEKARADRLAAERAAAEKAAAEAKAKAEAERLAAEKAAREKAEAERAAAEKAKAATKAEAQKQLEAIGATVYFANAGTKAQFDEKTDAAIHAICEAMKADNTIKVTVYGHTDNTGSLKANMKYGKQRAEALKAYMVNLGAPAANIVCESKGPKEPVADNKTKEGRAKNRRATVELK